MLAMKRIMAAGQWRLAVPMGGHSRSWPGSGPFCRPKVSPALPPSAASGNAFADVTCKLAEIEGRLGTLDDAATLPPLTPLAIVISGPSGVGKDAVIRQLQHARPDLFFVVTATSRPMRPGEIDGVDYIFVQREQFEEWIQAGDALLEHALVYDEYKGIPRAQVEDALGRGTDVVLRVDVQGAATLRRLLPDIVSIFLCAESETELVDRLVSRKTEPMDRMIVRIETARQEMRRMREFDYVVENRRGQLDATVDQIQAIIAAEKLRVVRRLRGTGLDGGRL